MTNNAIAPQPDLLAKIAELEAQLKAAKAEKAQTVTVRKSEKGGVSVYGLGRFPVTLYASQWGKLLASADGIKTFIESNWDQLAHKE